MKKSKMIPLIILVSVLCLCLGSCFSSQSGKDEPKIKQAEFNFELTFEVNGEMHTINDTLIYTYSISLHTHGKTVMYLMSDPGGEGYPPDAEPWIAVFNSKIDNYDSDRAEILENCGFKIIKWYCDPPIENSFK